MFLQVPPPVVQAAPVALAAAVTSVVQNQPAAPAAGMNYQHAYDNVTMAGT